MANRDALKMLIKKFPGPPELMDLFHSLHKDTDRSAAIVAVAIVESVLERLIISKLKNSDSNLVGMLFNNRGPMSDFHGKILIAHSMGIISPDMAAELHTMKAIRNVFAHATLPLTFQTPEIAEKMKEFHLLDQMDAQHKDDQYYEDIRKLNRGKGGFVLYAQFWCMIMDTWHQLAGGDHMLGKYVMEQSETSEDKSLQQPPTHLNKRDRNRKEPKRPNPSSRA